VLVVVGDGERDLCRLTVADETRDRDGLRIALDVGDEGVMAAVLGRELPELGGAETRLRAVEAGAAGLRPEALEHRHDGADVAVAERPHEEGRAVLGLQDACVHE
jgi:hypothetical protein